MAFDKKFASENVHVDGVFNKIANIFGKLGKDEIDELELARAAKQMDIPLSGISRYCEINKDGKLSLKWGGKK